MDMTTFIMLADAWADLGSVVQEQARSIMDDSDKIDEQNPNALRMFRDNVLKPMRTCGDDQLEREAETQIELINERIGAGR